MFERVLETVLDKALGEFVQDIDSKNLKLAVWSGNVVLKNLRLKAEALAKFDLPVYVHAGLIGSLELQVPWKALWTAPTKVFIEDLVLLVVPKDATPYSEDKAKKEERQRKQNMLKEIEGAQAHLADKGGKPEKQSWAESLITAIIKNLEIRIQNIHVRYEDPLAGYSLGVTLDHLFATTTDDTWRQAIIAETSSSRIFKLAKLSNFCVYWNTGDRQLFKLSRQNVESELLKLIVKEKQPNSQHQFVVHPMGCEVKITIDTGSNVVMDVPKASLSVHFTSLVTEVRKQQYINTISLIDHMERGKKKQQFAKWHPGVPIVGNPTVWWHYLYTFCVETVIKRKLRNWQWKNIKQHRDKCREYTALRIKQMIGKPSLNDISRITKLFDLLDIVNITICEQSAKLEAEKIQSSKTSWFGGWWGQKKEKSVVDKFGMTIDEKARINSAIEQSQAAVTKQTYPEKYVKFKIKCTIDKIAFKLNDDNTVITEAAIKGIHSEVGIIPNGDSIHLIYQVQTVYITSGVDTKILAPTDCYSIVPIFKGTVDINPTDTPADIAIETQMSSVTILFDMDMINSIIDFQKNEEELVDFDQLKQNINYYSKQLKSQGKAGLLYAHENRKIIDINLMLSAPKLIIPESGKLNKNGPLIVADLGRLTMTTEVVETRSPRQLLAMTVSELEDAAFDNYLLKLEDFHVRIYPNKQEWEDNIKHSMQAYVLYPIKLNVNLSNSILPDDKKLPKIKCCGHLDSVKCVMSDVKIKYLYKILDSLPKSESKNQPESQTSPIIVPDDVFLDVNDIARHTSIIPGTKACLIEADSKPVSGRPSPETPVSTVSLTSSSEEFFDATDHLSIEEHSEREDMVSQTLISAEFTINYIAFDMYKEGKFEGKVILKSVIKSITANVVKTDWVQKVTASLGQLEVIDCCTIEEPIPLVASPPDDTLINVTLQMNDPSSPYFDTEYKKTAILIDGVFDKLSAKVHIESFLELYEFGMGLLPEYSLSSEQAEVNKPDKDEDSKKIQSYISRKADNDVINVCLKAHIRNVTLSVEGVKKVYADIAVSNCCAEISLKNDTTEIKSTLKSIEVKQPSSSAMYNTILNVDSQGSSDLINFSMVQHNHKTNKLDPDMKVRCTLGTVNFIFLNSFVQNLLHVTDKFNRTRDKVVTASINTVKYAQQSSNSSIIQLEVEMASPVVKIPQNSNSSHGYKVTLGNISLKNSFSMENNGHIKDTVSIKTSNIAVSRVLLGTYGDTLRQRAIVAPFEMDLDITRYLSHNSDIDIQTVLKSIRVDLGYEDYHMLLQTLQDNLSETGDRVLDQATDKADKTTISTEVIASSNSSTSTVTNNTQTTVTNNTTKISVLIDYVTCLLYTNETNMDISSSECRDNSAMIMYSEVRQMSASLSVFGDGAKCVRLEMREVRVEDTSQDVLQHGIQRILSHKIVADEEAELIVNLQGRSNVIPVRRAIKSPIPKSMIEVSLELSPDGDISIRSAIQDIHLVISWLFVNQILEFFIFPHSSPDETAERSISTVSKQTTPDSTVADAEDNKIPKFSITVTLNIENPEFVLLSNHGNYKTQALLLRTGMQLHFQQVGDKTFFSITVDQLTMFICQYLSRLSSIYLLLQPCDITLRYSKTIGEKEAIDISISDIVFNISPESLNVMMIVLKQFGGNPETTAVVKEHTAYAYNLWNTEEIGKENRWYIRQAFNSSLLEVAEHFHQPNTAVDYFQDIKPLGQILLFNLDMFRITFEADYEPLIFLTGDANCTVKDWAGAMIVELNTNIEINYYSYNLGTFEPMLEPVEDENGEYRRWSMSCSVTKCPVEISDEAAQLMQMIGSDTSEMAETASLSSVDSLDILDNAPPVYEIQISSLDKLMLTITNSALKNFSVLSEAWSNVSDDMKIEPKVAQPLMMYNLCGVKVTIRGRPNNMGQATTEMELRHQEKRALNPEIIGTRRSKTRLRTSRRDEVHDTMKEITEAASVNIQLEGFQEIKDIKIVQAGLYLYGLTTQAKSSKKREKNLLIEVTVVRSSKTITIRSPLNIHNLQPEPVRLWFSAPEDTTDRDLICRIEPGEKFSVPVDSVITGLSDSHHLHISPDNDKYTPSFPSMTLSKLKKDKHHFISCHPVKNADLDPKFAIFSIVPLKVRNPMRINLENAIYHTIVINSPLVVINKLPVTLRVQPSGMMASKDVAAGDRAHFTLLDPLNDPYLVFRIINYHDMGFDWSGEFHINVKKFEETNQQYVTMTATHNNITSKVTLGVLCKINDSLTLTIYSSYWMVNCTGKHLRYQGINASSEVLDPPSLQQPMMFSFLHTDKNKQKLRIRVEDAKWSEYFSIDTVGSSGSIRSFDEAKEFHYEVGVTISLSNIQLTNIVTFYPRFQVINELQFPISVSEQNSEDFVECKCDKITPFWPGGSNDEHALVIKIAQGNATMPIPLDVTQQTVVRADCSSDTVCGFISIVVFVDVRTATTEVRVGMYYKGAAPVRLENLLSEASICFRQHEAMHTVTLPKNKSILYTWDYPSKRRELMWCIQGDERRQHKANFIKDNSKTFTYTDLNQRSRKAQVVSFLDGLQRVLVFTDNPAISECVGQEVIKIEQSQLVVELNIMEPVGISIVDSVPQEVAYIQADSSGAIWERKLKHRDRYKFLSTKISTALEEAYQQDKKRVEFDDHIADLTDKEFMKLEYPNKTESLIRRTFLPAFWLLYISSNTQNNIHFKMNKIQMDNQLSDYTFRHCFYPIKPPPHAVATQPPKPFIEFCVVKQTTAVEGDKEQSVLDHYKYVKMLVQEFHIKVDAGFLLCLLNFFKVHEDSDIDTVKLDKEYLEADLKWSRTALDDREFKEDGGPPVFLDEFHLSPLKIHISFSPQIFIDTTQVQVTQDTLTLYLRSFGLGLAAINDAVLKLAYYDATGQLCTVSQLQDRVTKHYIHQTLTQLYAVVFGLDIIGNPYSLAQNIKTGTKDLFYEPYMGIVQGPREFAEGVMIGVNSFLRHSVGGVVGAASKISRSVGKGLAKLTFDDEYQKRRTRRMAQKPSHIGEGLARGGKSFLMGIYHGVTGVVVKPIEGAAQEGVEGFFKGVGKGLVGAVTRPLGGINDMITYTIDGIHHHTQVDDGITFLRHPRYIQPDKILRPYNTKQSEGKYLLHEVGRQHGWQDSYYHHVILTTKSVFLLTDVRCILLQYDDILNHWKVEWSHLYVDITKLPKILNEEDGLGIIFSALMDPNAGVSRFFKNRRTKERIIILPNRAATQEVSERFSTYVVKLKPGKHDKDSSCWNKCCRCL